MASVNPITARAMAHAQTSTTSRRALLGGLAVAPLATQTEPAHPDAALLALEQRRAAAEALYRDADRRADALEDVGLPKVPDALYFRPSDYRLALEKFAFFDGEGRLWFYPTCYLEKDGTKWPYLRGEVGQNLYRGSEARQARIAEILQAYDAYRLNFAEAQKDSGFAALHALARKLGNDVKEIEKIILHSQPVTLEGLAIKANMLQRLIDIDCDVYDEAVVVVQDILRMASTSDIGRLAFRQAPTLTA